MNAPVIENFWNMENMWGVLSEAKHEVVILTPFVPHPKTADTREKAATIDAQMTGIHPRKKRIGTPVGLKDGFNTASP